MSYMWRKERGASRGFFWKVIFVPSQKGSCYVARSSTLSQHSNPLAMSRYLPDDMSILLATYINTEDLKNMYSTSSLFQHIAFEQRYKNIQFDLIGSQRMERLLSRLECIPVLNSDYIEY